MFDDPRLNLLRKESPLRWVNDIDGDVSKLRHHLLEVLAQADQLPEHEARELWYAPLGLLFVDGGDFDAALDGSLCDAWLQLRGTPLEHLAVSIDEALGALPEPRRGVLRARFEERLVDHIYMHICHRIYHRATDLPDDLLRRLAPRVSAAAKQWWCSGERKGALSPLGALNACVLVCPDGPLPPWAPEAMLLAFEKIYESKESLNRAWDERSCLAGLLKRLDGPARKALFERVDEKVEFGLGWWWLTLPYVSPTTARLFLKALRLQDARASSQHFEEALVAHGELLVEPLWRLVDGGDLEPEVAWHARRAHARILGPKALERWVGDLGSRTDEVAWIAFERLLEMGPEVAGAAVRRAASKPRARRAQWLRDIWEGRPEPRDVKKTLASVRKSIAKAPINEGYWRSFPHPPRARARYIQGVGFVVEMMANKWRLNLQRHSDWWPFLHRLHAHDERWLAITALELEPSNRGNQWRRKETDVLALLDESFGVRAVPYVREIFFAGQITKVLEVYQWLNGHSALESKDHLAFLTHRSKSVRAEASRMLMDTGDEVVEEVVVLLKSRKAQERETAAVTLRLMKAPAAHGPLQQALAKERSAKVKPQLKEAIAACDPIMRALTTRERSFGAYRPGEPFDVNQGLAQLRELAHAAPTKVAWVRLCDLLQRLEYVGALEVAMDYVQGSPLAGWPAKIRSLPWGWAEHPLLGTLDDPERSRPDWVPVSTFMCGRAEAYMDAILPREERRMSARCFVRGDEARFAAAVGVGWAWCESQGIGFEHLDVRVDGGTKSGSWTRRKPQSTALRLWHGYGAVLTRTEALRMRSPQPQEHGLQLLRARVPKEHPLRLELAMTGRQYHIDLMDLFDLETPS